MYRSGLNIRVSRNIFDIDVYGGLYTEAVDVWRRSVHRGGRRMAMIDVYS